MSTEIATHARGSFVTIPFGIGRQIARVEGYARDGSLKVRAWNGSKEKWMPNLRAVRNNAQVKPVSGAHLPSLPALPAA